MKYIYNGEVFTIETLVEAVDRLFYDEFLDFIDDEFSSATDLVLSMKRDRCTDIEGYMYDTKCDFVTHMIENKEDFSIQVYNAD